MKMTPDDRRRFADCVLREQNSRRFDGNKKAAYTAVGVTQATWENAINARPMTDQKIRQIVIHLWPEAHGDWRRIPGIESSDDLAAQLAERYAAGYAAGLEAARSDTPSEQGSSETA